MILNDRNALMLKQLFYGAHQKKWNEDRRIYWSMDEAGTENGRLVSEYEWLSEWVEFYLPLGARHIIVHFGNESFQAVTCTGKKNQTKQTGNMHQKYKMALAI